MQTEFKFKSQAIQSLFILLFFLGPVLKMVQDVIEFRQYYWCLVVFIVIQYLYVFVFKKLFLWIRGVPAIVMTNETIVLGNTGYSIEWADIQDLEFKVDGGESPSYVLKLTLNNPWKYISQTKNLIIRYNRWYILEYHNPFTIDFSDVEGDPYEIYNTVETYFNSYRRKKWLDL